MFFWSQVRIGNFHSLWNFHLFSFLKQMKNKVLLPKWETRFAKFLSLNLLANSKVKQIMSLWHHPSCPQLGFQIRSTDFLNRIRATKKEEIELRIATVEPSLSPFQFCSLVVSMCISHSYPLLFYNLRSHISLHWFSPYQRSVLFL